MLNNFRLRLISAVILSPAIVLLIYLGDYYFNLILFFLFIFSVYEALKLKNFKIKLLVFLLITLFIFFSYQIRSNNNGMYHTYFILIIAWLSDSGGYLFGKFFRGPKINLISPNKTYSGFFGSLVFSQFAIIFLIYYNIFDNYDFFEKMFLIFILSITVILGDLLFSYFKRVEKIKDYSNILPGHGGVLDRIDGLITITILYYLSFN